MDRVYLVDKDSAVATPDGFVNAEEALRLLQRAALNHDNLQHFRQVWTDALLGGGYHPPGDAVVLRYLAGRLSSGVLRLARKNSLDADPSRRRPKGGTNAPPPSAAPDQPPAPPAPPPLKLRPPALPPEIAKLTDPIVDLAKQAECLVDAARDGLPFVEQCAKP
jgi:hypothetical protein